mmetsp:Transcript_50874/g.147702  ORF Transcript_50874/g.147702 Transcript_50874/m.147702 type:complete len:319 (+) Transcript_50874:130-1086(+)
MPARTARCEPLWESRPAGGPRSATDPPSSTKTSSNSRIRCSRWQTTTRVQSAGRDRSSVPWMCSSVARSQEAVGSSQRRTRGPSAAASGSEGGSASARARQSSWRSPWLKFCPASSTRESRPSGRLARRAPRPAEASACRSAASSSCASAADVGAAAAGGRQSRLERTVPWKKMGSCSKTRTVFRSATSGAPDTLRPCTDRQPPLSETGYKRVSTERKLLLPQPVRPTTAARDPLAISNDKPLRTHGPSIEYRNHTFLASIAQGGAPRATVPWQGEVCSWCSGDSRVYSSTRSTDTNSTSKLARFRESHIRSRGMLTA